MSEIVSLKGEIASISERSWDGWKYGTLSSGGKSYPISGHLEGFHVGEAVELTGAWKEHPKYGSQFAVQTVMRSAPTGLAASEKWMIDRLPQIGPQRVKQLVSLFRDDLWDVIENEPRRLCAVAGITEERAEEIRVAYLKYKEERDYYVTCYSYGFNAAEVLRLRQAGMALPDFVDEVFVLYFVPRTGLSFDRLESIRGSRGQPAVGEMRVMAAVIEALRRRAQDGDTAVRPEELVRYAFALADVQVSAIQRAMELATLNGMIQHYRGHVQVRELAEAEGGIANKLIQLARGEPDVADPRPDARDSRTDDGV